MNAHHMCVHNLYLIEQICVQTVQTYFQAVDHIHKVCQVVRTTENFFVQVDIAIYFFFNKKVFSSIKVHM